jgi:hypothetical protein
MSRIAIHEPNGITPELSNYKSALSRAFNFYNQDRDKKDARLYLKMYAKHVGLEVNIESASDSDIILTYGWLRIPRRLQHLQPCDEYFLE